ncbi:MAG: hypothetical protein HQK50_00310, partial [Oligoflexia bacterium]|nr:hypothetical protein [Oligoflexia bacterium]
EAEVWKRQGDRAHQVVMDAAKIGDVKAGDQLSYHLTEKETPWLGNMLSDNLGGITKRWMNGRIVDKLTDYHTYFEDAWEQEKKVQRKLRKSESAESEHALKKKCERYNEKRKKFEEIQEKIELDEKIDDLKPEEQNKKDLLESEYQKLSAQKNSIVEVSPEMVDVVATNTRLSSEFGSTDCYMIEHYKKVKPLIEERVKDRLKYMDQGALDALSPTEKFDIASGYFDFRTTAFEKIYKGKKRYSMTKDIPFLSSLILTRYWEGRCNADRACGVCHRYEEPANDVTMQIAELARPLTFFPLDSKALLMSTYFYLEKDKYMQMGERTTSLSTEAPNPNPAAFDILLRSLFMKYKVPFVFDNHNDHRVNNVTLVGFDRKIVDVKPLSTSEKKKLNKKVEEVLKRKINPLFKSDPPRENSWNDEYTLYKKALDATKIVRVAVNLRFIHDTMSLSQVNGPTKAKIANKKLGDDEKVEYDLYLNDKNEIVEGDLISGELDFLWFAAGKGDQENRERKGANTIIKYDVVNKLAKAAAKGRDVTVERTKIFSK